MSEQTPEQTHFVLEISAEGRVTNTEGEVLNTEENSP